MDDPHVLEHWEEARRCISTGNLTGALFIFQGLADQGRWFAYVEIGKLHERGGGGIAQDFEQAACWYRKAVFAADDPEAHLALARLTFNGHIEDADHVAFFRHSEKALRAGKGLASLMLGAVYDSGKFGERDLAKAESYYKRASDEGYVLAMRYLARMHFHRRKWITAIFLMLRSIRQTFKLAFKDANDDRLAGLR